MKKENVIFAFEICLYMFACGLMGILLLGLYGALTKQFNLMCCIGVMECVG